MVRSGRIRNKSVGMRLNPGSVAESRCVLVHTFCRADRAGGWQQTHDVAGRSQVPRPDHPQTRRRHAGGPDASDLLTRRPNATARSSLRASPGDQSPRRAGFRFITQRHALGKAEIKKGSVTKPGFDPDGIAETEAATVRERSNDQNGRCLERFGLRFASRPSRSPRQTPIRCAITIHAAAITANNVATISKARPMHFAPGVGASDRAMMRWDGKGSKENPPGVNRRLHLSSSG
jgi:hypothetical protein